MDDVLPPLVVLVAAPLIVMFVGWGARTVWPHLKLVCLKWRGKRRCARGQHTMREIDRRVVHDSPDGSEEEILIACRWCHDKVTLGAHELWV